MASITVGQVVVELPGPLDAEVTRQLTDSGYLASQITRGWLTYPGNTVNGDRLIREDGTEETLASWVNYASNPDTYSDNLVHIGFNDYYIARMAAGNDGSANPALSNSLFGQPIKSILGKPEDFGLSDSTVTTYEKAVPLYQKALKGITAQCGLQEDDILYNLALLATNVLQPVKNRYPNMIIVSGFRQVNTDKSQHERGEAADIQLKNQTPQLLYEVADYIAKCLQFDQLVLNYTTEGRSWIHVSFSATSQRREVLTRDLNDAFINGLYVITPLIGEERAAAERDAAATLAAIDVLLNKQVSRATRAQRRTVSGDPLRKSSPVADDVTPDKLNIVQKVWTTKTPAQWGFDLTGPAANEPSPFTSAAGRFVEAVVDELRKDPTNGTKFGTIVKLVDRSYNRHDADRVGYAQVILNDAGVPVQTGYIVPIKILVNESSIDAAPAWIPEVPVPNTESLDTGEKPPSDTPF